MRKLFLALLVLAVMAAPALASVQNVKISGSIQSDFLHREDYDFGGQAGEDEHQDLFRSRVVVQIDADLTDNVSATINLMNERIWEQVDSASQDVDVNLAYVTLREMLYSPMTVVIGRQNFPIGNKLYFDGGVNGVVSSDSINDVTDGSTMDGTDAIRFIFDYNPLTLQAFYIAVDEGTNTLSANDDDTRMYGLVATYELGDEMNTLVEGTFLSKKTKTETAAKKTDHIKLLGIRAATNPMEGLGVSLEYAHQGGTKAISGTNNKTRDAHAVQFIANYQLPVLEDYNPVVMYSFTKLTGDSSYTAAGSNTNDEVWSGWDGMYEGQAPGKIINRVFGFSNAVVNTISLQANPMEDVTTKLTVAKVWLAQETQEDTSANLLLSPDNPTVSPFTTVDINKGERDLGIEVDLDTTYQYTEDVTFGLGLAILKPGRVFKHRDAAKQVLGSVKVAF